MGATLRICLSGFLFPFYSCRHEERTATPAFIGLGKQAAREKLVTVHSQMSCGVLLLFDGFIAEYPASRRQAGAIIWLRDLLEYLGTRIVTTLFSQAPSIKRRLGTINKG